MKNTKMRKKMLLSSIAMLMVATVSLGSATYAWFTNNTTAKAYNMDVKVSAPSGLQISLAQDSGFTSMLDVSTKSATLSPVSGNVADDAPVFRAATVNDNRDITTSTASASSYIAFNVYGKLSNSNMVDSAEKAKVVKLSGVTAGTDTDSTDAGQVVRAAFYSASEATKKCAYVNFSGSTRSTNALSADITAAENIQVDATYWNVPSTETTKIQTYTATNSLAAPVKVGTASYHATNGTLLGTIYVWVEGQDQACKDADIATVCKTLDNITFTFELGDNVA